jgi:hypothetical protein
MNPLERELKALGEETIYTAKGHLKAGDIRRNLVTITLWTGAVLSVISLIGITPPIDKWLGGVSTFSFIMLLLWDQGEGKNYRIRHNETGNAYLALHKEIRACHNSSTYNADLVNELNRKVRELDQKTKPDIPYLARRRAKLAIEKYGETDNWFKN